ncbi:MAG: T9SS type A sorting domain-containing protein, partial [Flexibacteraceae bacterium]
FEITDASGSDEMVIVNRANAVAGFDADDAEKFMNPMTNIYAVGTPNQGIASMNLNNVSAIPFAILNRNAGTVTLRTSQFNSLEGYTFNLFDEQTGELLPYTPDAVYSFTVSANQAYRLQLRVGSVTGIENFKANVFEVFPNPTTGNVTLTTTADAENVSVVNAVGQVVYTAKAQAQMEMNLNHLAKGVYMVQVQSAKGVSSQRLVIK